uniref:Cytochrome P450 76AD1-like protein n=1 Tax=Chenopodium quinoa TaxID=63459 RepID=A0A803MS72_CHEQI
MEYSTPSLLILPVIFTILFFSKLFTKSKLPPGPKPWPIIGNIHFLGDKPHRAVDELSKNYGPIMTLKLGSNTTIVISSPEIAKEMFLKHDLALSSRAIPDAARPLNHNKLSIGWLPVCPKWRTLRKVAAIHLFTNQRLNMSQELRHSKVKELIGYVQNRCEKGLPVDIGKAGFTTTINLLSNTLFSMDLGSLDSSNSQELKEILWHAFEEGERPNVSDLFPIVKYLDLQGVVKKTACYLTKLKKIFENIIDERLEDPSDVKDDVLSSLLKLVGDGDEELTLDDVKHLLMVREKY